MKCSTLILFHVFSLSIFSQEIKIEIKEKNDRQERLIQYDNQNDINDNFVKSFNIQKNNDFYRKAGGFILLPESVKEYKACALKIYSDGRSEKISGVNILLFVFFVQTMLHNHSGILPELKLSQNAGTTGVDGCFEFKVFTPFFSGSFILRGIPQNSDILPIQITIDVVEEDLFGLPQTSFIHYSKDLYHFSSVFGSLENAFSVLALAKMFNLFSKENLVISQVRLYGGGYACSTPSLPYAIGALREAHSKGTNAIDVGEVENFSFLRKASRTAGCTQPIAVVPNDNRRIYHFKCLPFRKGEPVPNGPVLQQKEDKGNKFTYELTNKLQGDVVPELNYSDGIFNYSYNVSVLSGEQPLETFQVGNNITLKWLRNEAQTSLIENFFGNNTNVNSSFPIWSYDSPENWFYGLDNWHHKNDGLQIYNGPVKFSLYSKRLPVLAPVYFWGKPKNNSVSIGGEPNDEILDGLDDPNKTASVVWTIGPYENSNLTIDLFRKNIIENILKIDSTNELKIIFESMDLSEAFLLAEQIPVKENTKKILSYLKLSYEILKK